MERWEVKGKVKERDGGVKRSDCVVLSDDSGWSKEDIHPTV